MPDGIHDADSYRRAAVYVDKILKGPSPLICRWSSRRSSELMINLMTAKALGLTIPQTVLLQAHQVIE